FLATSAPLATNWLQAAEGTRRLVMKEDRPSSLFLCAISHGLRSGLALFSLLPSESFTLRRSVRPPPPVPPPSAGGRARGAPPRLFLPLRARQPDSPPGAGETQQLNQQDPTARGGREPTPRTRQPAKSSQQNASRLLYCTYGSGECRVKRPPFPRQTRHSR